nr:hypothetical protein [Bacillus licheniformis]
MPFRCEKLFGRSGINSFIERRWIDCDTCNYRRGTCGLRGGDYSGQK